MKRKLCLCTSIILSATLAMSCGTKVTDTNTATNAQEASSTITSTETTTEVTNNDEAVEEEVEEVEEQTEPKVYFGVKSGFYNDPFDLTLTCPVENATIYYTTDGSIPTDASTKYEVQLH